MTNEKWQRINVTRKIAEAVATVDALDYVRRNGSSGAELREVFALDKHYSVANAVMNTIKELTGVERCVVFDTRETSSGEPEITVPPCQ